ncbi:alpha/beta hydrolase [Pseudothermotoga thermarum]|uniref:Esterase n=1 Tax=Pseudothermotoga thermarum DSM 5069 TaxID=688269 RepID=F7YXV1_9THEM|nr:alpha/beta hydrolase [Pseudothermotoga thermarum]AEH50750.1 esterase [Pseudothermotoga thermarum DSM 5069]
MKERIKFAIIKSFKFLLFIIIFFVTTNNFFVGILLFLVANIKLIRRSIFGRLPYKVSKKASRGPFSYNYTSHLKLDLYYPTEGDAPFPVVVFAHGGGWITGFKRQPNNVSWYRFLNSQGFAVASLEYRKAFYAKIDNIISDYSQAVKFIQENAFKLKVNPEKIVLMGLSAGGHLALYYTARNSFLKNLSSSIKAVVAFYAPCDLTDLLSEEVTSFFARFALVTTMKTLPVRNSINCIHYSPITWVSDSMPPVFLAHGLKDTVVPPKSSIKMYKKLRSFKVKAVLKIHPKGDHGFEFVLKDGFTYKILDDLVSFLKCVVEK